MKKNWLKLINFTFWMLLSFNAISQSSVYNIVDFGAKADGTTINTMAINTAIEKCNKNGGGSVIIPAGSFVSGTVILLSNVELYLSPGAVLLGSKDTLDYLLNKDILMPGEGYNRYGLIYANNAHDVSIAGKGTIDGTGNYFMYNPYQYKYRSGDFDAKVTRQGNEYMKPGTVIEDGPVTYPFRPGLLITITNCNDVSVTDITLKDSPEWTIRIGFCDGVKVRGITINNNPLVPNNDGIHCTVSRNITISDCNISAGDDAIIVSGFGTDVRTGNDFEYGNKTGVAENVVVTNCVLSSRSACIRIGYGERPIRNLVFSNLVMYASNRGIGIFAREESSIDHIIFSNIIINNRLHSGHWWGKGEPIHISAVKSKEGGKAGTINDIQFSGINAVSETGIVIQGSPESIITNIGFDHVKLQINRGKYTDTYGGNFDFRPAYPLSTALYKHDVPGVYVQYADQLKFADFNLSWGSNLPAYFTYGLWADHYKNLSLQNSFLLPAPANKKLSAIQLSNGTKPVIWNCSTAKGIQLLQSTFK